MLTLLPSATALRRGFGLFATALTFAVLSIPGLAAADSAPGGTPREIAQARQRGIDFLRTTQADDGSWTTTRSPGITGLVVTSLLQNGLAPDDPTVHKGLKHLESYIQKDGGVYAPQSSHRNYETCIAVLAFSAANREGRYTKQIAAAEKFLRKLQWDEDEGKERSDESYGGAGYGSHSRPDLSNTSFLIEALKAAGVASDDPAMQKALIFVSRSQNLETEANTTAFAARVNDGGFYYTPAAGGSSQAGTTDAGGLRSYASMTYAGLKSMIYAGVGPEDPRVKAASDWIRRHYTVASNPGLDQQGLYYYLHTFAKALDALGVDAVEDQNGLKHDWRRDLAGQLLATQKANGSWVNEAPRWNEGDPNLVTAYALLALSYCDSPKEK